MPRAECWAPGHQIFYSALRGALCRLRYEVMSSGATAAPPKNASDRAYTVLNFGFKWP
jgi:hypothetical protein